MFDEQDKLIWKVLLQFLRYRNKKVALFAVNISSLTSEKGNLASRTGIEPVSAEPESATLSIRPPGH